MLLCLASTSPARLATLRAAGIDPVVAPSHVDEPSAVAEETRRLGRAPSAAETVALLARAKAHAVARALPAGDTAGAGFVLGCDSVFELGGRVYGKPHTPAEALRRWHLQRGATGTLYTGHCLVDLRDGRTGTGAGRGSDAERVARAGVTFASDISEAEIHDYIATGEPLEVAGAFTIDGLGGPFVTRVDGDPSTVVGLSLSVLRDLVGRFDVPWTAFWTTELSISHNVSA